MPALHLHNQMTSDSLIIPGTFITSYLPSARGDDVKIFLYLLYAVSKPDTEISLASLSDTLDISERDILRSLSYWEKNGLLRLSFTSDHALDSIVFLEMTDKRKQKAAPAKPLVSLERIPEKIPEPELPREIPKRIPHDLTPQEEASLDTDFDFTALIMMAEQCFGTTLSPIDHARLGYWYINFGSSSSIIESLFEYCTAQCQPGRPNIRYFDTVAAGWFSEGILTAEQARDYSQFRNTLVYGVMKSLGLKSRRDPNPDELNLIRKWSKEYGFSNEMIFLACSRSINAGNKQFAYANKILTSWYEQHITTPTQVEESDIEFRKRSAPPKRTVEISKSARQFHNFEERNTDYEALILDQYRNQNN